jgi:hypothetical protein
MNLCSPLWLPLIHVASLNYNLLKKSVGFIIIHLVDLCPIWAISFMGVTLFHLKDQHIKEHISGPLWNILTWSYDILCTWVYILQSFLKCQIPNLWEVQWCIYHKLGHIKFACYPISFLSRRQLMMVIMFVHLILTHYRSQPHSCCWILGNVKTLLYSFTLLLQATNLGSLHESMLVSTR